MLKEKYRIRSSTQLKNWVKKQKEFDKITDTRGKCGGMKDISNPLKSKNIYFKTEVDLIWAIEEYIYNYKRLQ